MYGCTPFNIDNINDCKYIRNRIAKDIKVNIQSHKNISFELRDFINTILTSDVKSRPSIDFILNHSFLY